MLRALECMLTRVIRDGRTALRCAIELVQPASIEALVKMKADVNIRSQKGRSTLEWAKNKKNNECIAVLLAAGATWSSSPLHDAAAKGQASVIESLVSQGADVDARTE